jgi:TRAP-type transport system small permease protein
MRPGAGMAPGGDEGDSMHGGAPKSPVAEPKRLIEVADEDYVIEHHFEDWLAFALFWALAGIVFLQFFTRYVLNDSLAWTEEIARYGLMALTFLGGAVVTRRNNHIAVALLPNLLPAGYARALIAAVDLATLGFLALLAYFSALIVERMQYQRMTVVDLPMSLVYGAVAIGCFLMLARQAHRVWRNARDGWRSAYAPITAPIETANASS